MLFLSPKNTLDGHLNVLDGVDCHIFLGGKGSKPEEILLKRNMKTGFVPELHEFLDDSPVDTYPYHKTFDEARMDPCLVLHTTGSTGLPKPITWKNANLATYEAWRTIPPVSGYAPTTVVYQEARRAYTSMPLYHTSGLNTGITWALLLGVTLVYGYPGVVPNADYADQMHIHGNVDATMGAPSIYEDLSRDPDSLSRLNKLHYVVASGAPLSQAAGAAISKHTRVISNLGSTETACLQRLAPAIDDWSYFYWHPTHSGIQMREFEGGLFELFLVREPGLELYQGIFATFPDIEEWSMSDLYERHPDPEKPFLYRYVGRRDDVIVLSNGEKVAPALMEAALRASPLVRGAMIVGRGKFQPAALLDLHGDPPSSWRERQQVVLSLRSFIDEANNHAPAHGKLDRHNVLFADPERPVCYLGQGKIQRHQTYKVYEEDIDRLYRELEDGEGAANGVRGPAPASNDLSEQSMARYISGIIGDVAGVRGLPLDRDLFEAGVDSLQVMRLATEIRLTFGGRGARPFTGRDIYANPTIGSLATFLVERTRQSSSNGHFGDRVNGTPLKQLSGSTRGDPVAEMTSLLDKYAATLPRPSTKSRYRPTAGITVLLTGSTGSLGSYILDTLYHDTNVSRIICLNRCADAAERHGRSGKSRGLSPLSPARVDFLKADLSRSKLGLSEEVYRELVGSVTHIIRRPSGFLIDCYQERGWLTSCR